MEIRRYDIVEEFRAAADPIYRRDPVNSTIELTVLHGTIRPVDPLLLIVCSDGAPVGAAMQTPSRPLLSSGLPDHAIDSVVAEVARIRPELSGVHGLCSAARKFANAWQAATGSEGTVGMEERLYRLGSLRPPIAVEGTHRMATDADSALLDAWLTEFHREARGDVPREPRPRAAPVVLWEVHDAPVSLAAARGPAAGVTRIGPVYTPVELRGHGYGSAVTAAAAQWAIDAGAVDVVLFTDLANPVSNSIYQRIGFEPVSDWLRIDFPAGR
jgi:GNAT superfamily N-acetyltransferase